MHYMRYLSAKRTVDDRALNASVLGHLKKLVARHEARTDPLAEAAPFRVVEIGAGIGAMLVRLCNYGTFACLERVEYTLLDVKQDLLVAARMLAEEELALVLEDEDVDANAHSRFSVNSLRNHFAEHSGTGEFNSHLDHLKASLDTSGDEQRGDKDGRGAIANLSITLPSGTDLVVRFIVCNGLELLQEAQWRASCDAVIAASFLDLFSLRRTVGVVLGALRPAPGPRLFYFALNFDGVTSLTTVRSKAGNTGTDENHGARSSVGPADSDGLDAGGIRGAGAVSRDVGEGCPSEDDALPGLDEYFERVFHASMGIDEEDGEMRAHTGRRLVQCLYEAGAQDVVAGSSAWTVLPRHRAEASGAGAAESERYGKDEEYFLKCIVGFFSSALRVWKDSPEAAENDLADLVDSYIEARAGDVRNGRLSYIAHNMDYCGTLGQF